MRTLTIYIGEKKNLSYIPYSIFNYSHVVRYIPLFSDTTFKILAEVGFGFNQFSCMNGFIGVHN